LEEDTNDDETIACPSVHLVEASPSTNAVEPQVPEPEPTTRDVDPRRPQGPQDDEEDAEDVETICDVKPGSRALQAAAPSSAVRDEADDAPDAPTLVPSPPRSSSHRALVTRMPALSVRPHPALRPLSSQPIVPHIASRPLPPRPRLPSEGSLPMSERITLRPPPLRDGDDASSEEASTFPRDAKTSEPGADAPALARRPSSVNHRVAFSAPQFSPPRHPQPFVIPAAPVTQRMVDDETRVGIVKKPAHLAQSRSGPMPFVNLQAPSSIAPVAMSTALRFGSRGDLTVKVRNGRRFTPAAALAVSALVGLLATGAVGFVALVPGVRAKVSGSSEKSAAASPPSPEPPPPSTVIVPPPPSHVPPVSLDLRPPVEPDMTYVTFLDSAQGHRVYVDGQLLSTGAEPTKIKCGPHTIKIGAAGKAKNVDLPCGEDYAFTD
jgi:hypothetical protein